MLFFCYIFNSIFIIYFICQVIDLRPVSYRGHCPPLKELKDMISSKLMWHIPHQDYCIQQFQCRDCCIWWFQHSKKENLSVLKKKSTIFLGWDRINVRQTGCWRCLQPFKPQFPVSNSSSWYHIHTHTRVVRALDQRPQFQVLPWLLAEFVHGSLEFKSSSTLVNSQLVCLRPVWNLNPVNYRHLHSPTCTLLCAINAAEGK